MAQDPRTARLDDIEDVTPHTASLDDIADDEPKKVGPSATSRFFSSLRESTGLSHPIDTLTHIANLLPTNLVGMKNLGEAGMAEAARVKDAYDKAYVAYLHGDPKTTIKEGVKALPLIGAPLGHAEDQVAQGDYAGAAGTATGVAATLAGPKLLGPAGRAIAASPVRGVARVVGATAEAMGEGVVGSKFTNIPLVERAGEAISRWGRAPTEAAYQKQVLTDLVAEPPQIQQVVLRTELTKATTPERQAFLRTAIAKATEDIVRAKYALPVMRVAPTPSVAPTQMSPRPAEWSPIRTAPPPPDTTIYAGERGSTGPVSSGMPTTPAPADAAPSVPPSAALRIAPLHKPLETVADVKRVIPAIPSTSASLVEGMLRGKSAEEQAAILAQFLPKEAPGIPPTRSTAARGTEGTVLSPNDVDWIMANHPDVVKGMLKHREGRHGDAYGNAVSDKKYRATSGDDQE